MAVGRALLILLMFLGIPPAATAGEMPEGLTLADCYALALKQSEKVAIQQELITEAEGRFQRAFGGVLPHASFSSSDKRQDGSGGSAFTLKEVPERKFEFTQTLFGGFKELAAMRAARAEKRQRTHEKTRAEQLLFMDVANAFYLLLEQQKDLEALEATRTALTERIGELKEREELGRSRPSEVVSAEANLARNEAEGELVRSREVTARQLLEFLTGQEGIQAVTDQDLAGSSSAEGDYLTKGDGPPERRGSPSGGRPDVRAAEEALQVAEKQVTVARSGFWPTVGLEGAYYVERAGAAESVEWDATLTVDVPIFEGTQTIGTVKEATARKRQAELRLAEAKRAASLDIRDAYAKFEAAVSRETALEKALKASEEDYRLQVEDYRLNLVNNLDVLETLEDLQDARRDFIHAHYETKRFYWNLRIAIGDIMVSGVEP